jgi:hypothetical protein
MARLWLNNLPPDFSEDDLAAFLDKYGFPPFDALTPMPDNATGKAVVLSFDGMDEELLRRLQPRIHNVFVGDRTIRAHVAPPARQEPW